MADRARIVEVGPRDGLQNEPEQIPTDIKRSFLAALAEAGLRDIEATSFVHPKVIPQLSDAMDIATSLPAAEGVTFSALVPNEKGLDRAIESGISRIALFTAASETFAQKNIRMTIEQSLEVFQIVATRAIERGLSVRAYLSTCFVCPYEGDIDEGVVTELTGKLLELGADEVAISDTIGAAAPNDILRVLAAVSAVAEPEQLALHLHDTYGTALANVSAGLDAGIRTFDASAGGLGGCPFAPGASGNLATEDLVYMLGRMGIETGVNLDRVVSAAAIIAAHLDRELPSRQWRRLRGACPADASSATSD